MESMQRSSNGGVFMVLLSIDSLTSRTRRFTGVARSCNHDVVAADAEQLRQRVHQVIVQRRVGGQLSRADAGDDDTNLHHP